MNGTPSERTARTAAERTLDTLKYFFEAALDDARTVLRTAQAIVRDRENGNPEASAAGKPKQPAARSQRSTPLTEAQVRDIRRRYQPDETASVLAQEYGRSVKTIGTIACRGTWQHLSPEPGEYRQPGPATSGKTEPSKTPPPASPPETAPRPAAATAPKGESAAPAAADTNTGAGTTTKAPHTPAAEPPKKTTPARQAGVQGRGKEKITAPKLTEAQVREIRRAYRPGGKTKALAKKYGISTSNILNIAHRRSWNHLEPGPGEYQPPADTAGSPETSPANPRPLRGKHVGASARTIAAAAANGSDRGKRKTAPGGPAAPDVDAEKKRLTPDSIRSIREQAAEGVKARRIARSFGVSEDTVHALAG